MLRIQTDFLVVGSGIAGLTAALSLAQAGRVIVLTKSRSEAGNSFRAQGGIAAAIGENDSPELHLEDTLRTGAGHCDPESVRLMVRMAPETIKRLVDWGTPFDREGERFALGMEGSHSARRILHVRGDATGAGITASLLNQVKKHPNIALVQHTMVADLIVAEGACRGAVAADAEGEATMYFARRGVVLATGGCGQVYRHTTNDLVATGDGFAMAYRAGAELKDMEFVQFHPTALAVEQNPLFLVSEAVRGEGALLVNDRGEAFMARYHEWRDLAPRDVVSRAIYSEMQEGRKVFLDATTIGHRFRERFPKIYAKCLCHGIDPATDLIPVTPAMHFIMGGVRTDRSGRTSIPRLFACGEVACTGVHGANRLASNSLLEGAVFAQRVAKVLVAYAEQRVEVPDVSVPVLFNDKQTEESWKNRIRHIMWDFVGIVRNGGGLKQGISALEELERQIPEGFLECRNMLTTAQMIAKAALWRRESRGGHYRSDFPESDPAWRQFDHVIQGVG
jgi:L-aspartate oxidase